MTVGNIPQRARLTALLICSWVWLTSGVCVMGQTDDDRYPVVKDGKLGVIDSRGNEVIAAQFFPIADMAHFHDGLAPVGGPDGAGYIDVSGRFVIGPTKQWGQPRPFHDGIAAVLVLGENGAANTPAFIDQAGKIVFSGAGAIEQAYFAEGLMPLRDSGKVGFVNKSFRWVIPPRCDSADEFSNGRAAVQRGGRWGYIDKSGSEIVAPKYSLAWRFSDGVGRIRIDIDSGQKSMTVEGPQPVYHYEFGFVGSNGKEVIHPQFEWATNFRQDRAFVILPGSRLFGIINKQGNIVHEPEYEQTGEFSEGVAAVCVNSNWGYVDNGGRWVIAPQFSSADEFRHGLARVGWRDGYGYIERSGIVIWKATTKRSPR